MPLPSSTVPTEGEEASASLSLVQANSNARESAPSVSSPDNEWLVPTSIDEPSFPSKKGDRRNEALWEALETETMDQLSEVGKTLLLDLQKAMLDWSDEMLALRGRTHGKLLTLKNVHQSDKSPTLAAINFELRALEKEKDVHDKEHAIFYATVTKDKQETSQ